MSDPASRRVVIEPDRDVREQGSRQERKNSRNVQVVADLYKLAAVRAVAPRYDARSGTDQARSKAAAEDLEPDFLAIVVDQRLEEKVLAGDDYSIADVATYPWTMPKQQAMHLIDVNEYPNVLRLTLEAVRLQKHKKWLPDMLLA